MLYENVRLGNPRQDEYIRYLVNHTHNVWRVWSEQLGPVILNIFPDVYYEAEKSIRMHDYSKYDDDEFDAYCNYFYPSEEFPSDESRFNEAWLIHQNKNPHHWQYWVLISDSGHIEPQDMPLSEICNMLCDWGSFSAKDPNSTAYSWYLQNKDNMILSKNTRDCVEYLIQYLKDPLPDCR